MNLKDNDIMTEGTMNIKTISPKDLLIYLCLRRYRNKTTGESTVPITQIVIQTGAAPVTVLSSLSRLASAGHIEYIKRGRANYYSFSTQIDAKSYDFLDQPMTHAQKIDAALKEAVISQPKVKQKGTEDTRIHDYMVELEKQIIQLKNHVRMLTSELDKMKRCTSVLTGQTYNPLPDIDWDDSK